MNYLCPKCNVDIPKISVKNAINSGTTVFGIAGIGLFNKVHSCPRCNTRLHCRAHPFHKYFIVFLWLSPIVFVAGILQQKIWISFVGMTIFLIVGLIYTQSSSYKKWKYYR